MKIITVNIDDESSRFIPDVFKLAPIKGESLPPGGMIQFNSFTHNLNNHNATSMTDNNDSTTRQPRGRPN